MNIAIISPTKDAYSETFIQAHRNRLTGTVHYLFGGFVPNKSDYTHKEIISGSYFYKLWFKLRHKFFNSGLSKAQYALKLYFKKNNIQCVLAEYGTTAAQIYPVCEQLKIPLIVHFHGYDASVHEVIENNREQYRKMFAVATYVIGVSQAMVKKLKDLGVDEEKLVYNTYGPDNSFFDIERNPDHKPVFFGVGRFVDKKAPYYTIIAFSKVVKRFPEARLVMGGNGPLLETAINLSRSLGIENKVDFPGVLTPKEVRDYMSNATAFVQHSITALNGDMEGTPVGILEASAAGLPVISTFHAGIPDVIMHEKTGLLCEEHDYEKMAENMLWVLEHPEQAKAMGSAGRKNISENFSMERHLNKLNQLINNTVYG